MKTIENFFTCIFRIRVAYFMLFLLVECPNEIFSQGSSNEIGIFDLVMTDSIRHFKLETNFTQLIRTKNKETYQPALLTYYNQQNEVIKWTVQLRTRGNMRKRICYFPPFKIKFDKLDLEKAQLNKNWNDIKVVTACRTGKAYNQYVVQEYLVYKLFNVLTDKSFRVQLVVFHIQEEEKSDEMIGFMIEPEKELAAKFGGDIYEPNIINPKYTLSEQYDLMAVFQYMIGNTDWLVGNKHNVKTIKSRQYKLPFCVPYDFDYAGIINTNYAIPHESLPIKNVTERLFRGLCRVDGEYEKTASLFIQKKSALYAVIEDCIYLTPSSKQNMKSYLDDFFTIIESNDKMKEIMLTSCVGLPVKK